MYLVELQWLPNEGVDKGLGEGITTDSWLDAQHCRDWLLFHSASESCPC